MYWRERNLDAGVALFCCLNSTQCSVFEHFYFFFVFWDLDLLGIVLDSLQVFRTKFPRSCLCFGNRPASTVCPLLRYKIYGEFWDSRSWLKCTEFWSKYYEMDETKGESRKIKFFFPRILFFLLGHWKWKKKSYTAFPILFNLLKFFISYFW